MISMLTGGTILLQFQGSRVMDKAAREHILTGKIYISEQHFKTEDIELIST